MGLPAKQDNCLEQHTAAAEVVPMPLRDQEPSEGGVQRKITDAVQQYTERATDLVNKTSEVAQRTYELAKDETVQSYSRMVHRAQDLGRRTQDRMKQTKNEHPLQLLAVIAGTAFVLGVAIRIWRSRT